MHGGDLDTDDEESDDDQENTETPEEERRDTQGPDDVGLFGHSVRDLDAFQATDEYDESYTSGEMPDLRNVFTANSTSQQQPPSQRASTGSGRPDGTQAAQEDSGRFTRPVRRRAQLPPYATDPKRLRRGLGRVCTTAQYMRHTLIDAVIQLNTPNSPLLDALHDTVLNPAFLRPTRATVATTFKPPEILYQRFKRSASGMPKGEAGRLFGNADMHTLQMGTPEEVEERVRGVCVWCGFRSLKSQCSSCEVQLCKTVQAQDEDGRVFKSCFFEYHMASEAIISDMRSNKNYFPGMSSHIKTNRAKRAEKEQSRRTTPTSNSPATNTTPTPSATHQGNPTSTSGSTGEVPGTSRPTTPTGHPNSNISIPSVLGTSPVMTSSAMPSSSSTVASSASPATTTTRDQNAPSSAPAVFTSNSSAGSSPATTATEQQVGDTSASQGVQLRRGGRIRKQSATAAAAAAAASGRGAQGTEEAETRGSKRKVARDVSPERRQLTSQFVAVTTPLQDKNPVSNRRRRTGSSEEQQQMQEQKDEEELVQNMEEKKKEK